MIPSKDARRRYFSWYHFQVVIISRYGVHQVPIPDEIAKFRDRNKLSRQYVAQSSTIFLHRQETVRFRDITKAARPIHRGNDEVPTAILGDLLHEVTMIRLPCLGRSTQTGSQETTAELGKGEIVCVFILHHFKISKSKFFGNEPN